MLDENRPVVTAPDVVVWVIKKLHPLRHRLRSVARRKDGGVIGPRRIDPHRFEARNGGRDLCELRPDHFPLRTAPMPRILHRPREPYRLLWRPFRWHRKSRFRSSRHGRNMTERRRTFPAFIRPDRSMTGHRQLSEWETDPLFSRSVLAVPTMHDYKPRRGTDPIFQPPHRSS